MKGSIHTFSLYLILTVALPLCLQAQQPLSPLEASFQTHQRMKADTKFNLDWVSLGPTVNSARADIVQGDPVHPGTMYVGFGSGGVWKTTNNGLNWQCVFQNQSAVGVGDMELAPSDPNVIYVGTGENLKKPRNFTLPGTGMYRSSDAGRTWQHIGLEDSWSVAEIAIHPTNPDIVLVAVLGHLWTPNQNRGLYRTENGGKSWERVLYVDDHTGANDIVICAKDPLVMYTSMWEVYPGISGKNSGVYKSEDGGKSWKKCMNGIPSGPLTGRMGVAVSATDPKKAYALIDNLANPRNEAAELYKTTDGGNSWKKTHSKPFKIFPGIGWYFTHVYVNPKDDEEVYGLGVRLAHSTDGGKTFSYLGGQVTHMTPSQAQGFHLDQCEVWIDPNNPDHLMAGNDGGLYVTYDKGKDWTHYNNIPAGEFYDITVDQRTNTVYGGTQDDATVFGPATEINTSFPDPWKYIWIDPWDGGDGCVSQVDPENSNTVYYSSQHGGIVRYDRKADTVSRIMPELAKGSKDSLVFNYMTPYFISPHAAQTLYHGGNFIMKSINRGDDWTKVSPDLSRSTDPAKRSNATGAIAESPLVKGLLYAGTDKGACWVSVNDGNDWKEISAGLANNYIRSICPSRFNKERVYVAMTGLNYDDLHAYLYVSDDQGAHWRSLTNGLPDEPVNVIMEDPTNENLLYAGTIRGVYISTDRGQSWSVLGMNMPGAAISDLDMISSTHELLVATHGRGIYKMNVAALQQMVRERSAADGNYFFPVPVARRPWYNAWGGEVDRRTVERTPLSFWVSRADSVSIAVLDTAGKQVWKTNLLAKAGFNQYRWDLVTKTVTSDQAYFVHYVEYLKAGKYTVRLTVGKTIMEQAMVVVERESPYGD